MPAMTDIIREIKTSNIHTSFLSEEADKISIRKMLNSVNAGKSIV